MAQLLDASGVAIRRAEIARAKFTANYGGMGAREGFANAYDSASHHGAWFGRWPSNIMSADREWLPSRDPTIARTRDLLRNETVAPAVIARRKNAAIGKGWRLSSKPSARALGIEQDAARELGQQIETEWKLYAYGHNFPIDAERKLTFGQLLRVAASHLMMDGEFLGLVEWAEDEPTRYRTRLRMVDPDRLSNPPGEYNNNVFRAGIEHDLALRPIRYWIRQQHPADFGVSSMKWDPWERFSTPLGRPQVLHGFDPDRADQSRGVTRFASVLKSFRALSRFTDATLQSATINALILGYIQSNAGPGQVSEYFEAKDLAQHELNREVFYDEHPVKLGDTILPAIPLGDELKLATATRDVTSFDAFVRSIIRLIASSLGVTYEEVSMDYSQTNYSSARAAMIHAWAETVAFMSVLEAQLVKPFFVAWLEEAFDRGYIVRPAGAPEFYDAPDAYAEGRWIGPGRGYVDPVKEILAAAARIEMGVSTLETECADLQGTDYVEVLEQQAFEQDLRIKLGLQPTVEAMAQALADTKNPARGASHPTDPQGDPAQVAPEDQRPNQDQGPADASLVAFSVRARLAAPKPLGVMHQLRGVALSAEHEAFLDARPGLAA